MEPWTIILSFWLSTWLMLVWRTYPVMMRIIERKPEGRIVLKYRAVHFVMYILSLFILTHWIFQVVFSENKRKMWVLAYVNAILGIKK
jgi:hypothetical protein